MFAPAARISRILLLPRIERIPIVGCASLKPQSKFGPTMRNKGLPPLEDRFEFFGDGMPAADHSPFASSIFEVEERATGTPFNLKLWQDLERDRQRPAAAFHA